MAGSISFLIDSPLRDLAVSLRAVGPELRAQINSATKSAANPIWQTETANRSYGSLQSRALAGTARVLVSSANVELAVGGRGFKGKSGDMVTRAAEFGGGQTKVIAVQRKGKTFKRRLGNTFGPRYRKGRVAYPAASDSIPRFASLWVQTARRTIHEAIEKGAR